MDSSDRMKTKTFADGLPHTDVAAQTIDNAAVICVNSGSVKIGKGSDENCTINHPLTVSLCTVISNTVEGSSNVNTAPMLPKKKVDSPTVESRTNEDTWVFKAHLPILATFYTTMLLVWLVTQNIKEVKTK